MKRAKHRTVKLAYSLINPIAPTKGQKNLKTMPFEKNSRTLSGGILKDAGSSRKKCLPVFLSTAIVLVSLGFMFADSPADTRLKVGYVDSSTILSLLPSAQAAQAKLDTLVQDWSDTIDQMSKEYQTKVEDYTRQSEMMTRQAKLAAQNEIANLQQDISAYRQAKIGTGGALDRIRHRLLKPIRARIYSAIAQIAKREGMEYIFNKSRQLPVLLYEDRYYDITYKVLDLLRRTGSD